MAQTKRKEVWRPKGCQYRYATFYDFVVKDEKPEQPVEPETVPDKPVEVKKAKGPWCPACMREAFDPFFLRCGHSFCRRCFANFRHPLVSEHAEAVKDVRTQMWCPVVPCKGLTHCLPLINGDFRFKEIRPEDKVPFKESDNYAVDLQTYKLNIDVDVTIRKSDDLFEDFYDTICV